MSLSPVAHSIADLASPLGALAAMFIAEPRDNQIAYLRNPIVTQRWPLTGPEFQRGVDLIIESAIAHETTARICADYRRQLAPAVKLSAQPLVRHHRDVTPNDVHSVFTSHCVAIESDQPADQLGVVLTAIATAARSGNEGLACEWTRAYLGPWAIAACEQLALRSATMFYQGVFSLTATAIGDLNSASR